MNKHLTGLTLAAFSVVPALIAGESEADKPQGFRFFNQHLTIKPYVAISYSYDSNIDTTDKASGDSIFCIQPGADFEWKGDDRWSLVGSLWYRRNAYCKYANEMGENSFGESLAYKWTTSKQNEKGWSLTLAEKYRYIDQSDALGSGDGRGIWRDREAFDISGVFERRFSQRLHAEVMAQYNWLDYKNDTGKYAPLYGWSEWSLGGEAGYAASAWTDILLAGGYSDYTQKKGHGYHDYSNDSHVWTVQGGLATRATEKISYRALVGASWLDYGGHSNADRGWTYSLSANWRITRQLQWSALGSSYYQPSERTRGQAVKVYALSTGLSYLTLGDKMTLSGNIAFRHEDVVYSDRYLAYGNDYDEDFFSARVGADYILNRWMSLFANFTWEEEWCDKHSDYDYHRFRGTVGVRFHY
jgi:hypothetical protein